MKPYRCEICAEEFTGAWSDEEALAEAAQNGWGDLPMDDLAVICDDCYKERFPSLSTCTSKDKP